jgi:hypothetical protein
MGFVETIPMHLFFCMLIPFIQKLRNLVQLKIGHKKRKNIQGREKERKSFKLKTNIFK